MTSIRLYVLGTLCATLGTLVLPAADLSSYRGFRFGMNPAEAAKLTGTPNSQAKLVHQRPALIEEMIWQPRSHMLVDASSEDPVKEGLLTFVNGELFRIVITYDRYRVEGMTADDMVEAISANYGAATRPTTVIAYHSNFGEVGEVIARWEDPSYSYNLVRTGDRSSFAMIMYSKRADALAQAAMIEAARLDTQEAPQREAEKQKKQEKEGQLVLDKARSTNKPNFRP